MAKTVDVLQVSQFSIIQRTRRLPVAGRVLVAAGDAVRPADLVAEAVLPAGVITLAVDRGLGVGPQEADACALRQPGDVLREGDLLAQCEGTLTRAVRAPADGTLIDFSRGKAIIATGESKISLQAGMPGVVEDITPEFGVTLRAEGSLVQAEWGNGGIAEGPLRVLDSLEFEDEGEDEIEAGEILALPSVDSREAFDLIRRRDLAGLITFWMAPKLMRAVKQWHIPLLVVSGMGAGEVDPKAWEILLGNQGKVGSLNAGPALDSSGQRPELIIPGEGTKPDSTLGLQAALAAGQRVRILTGAAMGQVGLVSELEAPLMFESGFAFPIATVELASGALVQVPQQDLVILGC